MKTLRKDYCIEPEAPPYSTQKISYYGSRVVAKTFFSGCFTNICSYSLSFPGELEENNAIGELEAEGGKSPLEGELKIPMGAAFPRRR